MIALPLSCRYRNSVLPIIRLAYDVSNRGAELKILIKICGAGVLSLLLWQLIIMNTMINSTGYVNHPILGRIYKAGTYVHGTEGFSRTKINSLGMRGEEIQSKKEKEFRVLVLGDSFTEAFQVSDENIYPRLLEKMVKKRDGHIVRAVNAGRSGASPAFYIHLAKFYNTTFKQDYTIIQLNDGDFTEDMMNPTRNFYAVKDENGFNAVENEKFSSANPLLQRIPQARDLLEISVVRVAAEKLQGMLTSSNSAYASVLQDNRQNVNDEQLIDWTLKELKKQYSHLLLVYIPELDYNDLGKQSSEIERYVNRFSELNHIDLLNMRDDFIHYFETQKQPANGFDNTMPGTGHINEVGHFLIAKKLKQFFERSSSF
jgi:hypothetical protein